MDANVRALLKNYEDGGITAAEGFFTSNVSGGAFPLAPRLHLEMVKLYYLSGRADKADSLLQKLSSIPKQLQGGGPEAAEASAWKAELDRYARYRMTEQPFGEQIKEIQTQRRKKKRHRTLDAEELKIRRLEKKAYHGDLDARKALGMIWKS